MRTCDKCEKTFPNKNSLRKHPPHVHKIPAYLFVLKCNVCHKVELSVSEMDKHFHENHGTQLEKMCVYCEVGFDNPEKFYKYLLEKRDLPPPGDCGRETTKPISSASLNIGNRQDHNCFLYCFTAAWHLKHGPLRRRPRHIQN